MRQLEEAGRSGDAGSTYSVVRDLGARTASCAERVLTDVSTSLSGLTADTAGGRALASTGLDVPFAGGTECPCAVVALAILSAASRAAVFSAAMSSVAVGARMRNALPTRPCRKSK